MSLAWGRRAIVRPSPLADIGRAIPRRPLDNVNDWLTDNAQRAAAALAYHVTGIVILLVLLLVRRFPPR